MGLPDFPAHPGQKVIWEYERLVLKEKREWPGLLARPDHREISPGHQRHKKPK